MGRSSRAVKKKKAQEIAAVSAAAGVETNLRMSLMNMRHLYEQAVQEKKVLQEQLWEAKVIIAALTLTKIKGKGTASLTQETLKRAGELAAISVDQDDEGTITIAVVEQAEEEESGEES